MNWISKRLGVTACLLLSWIAGSVFGAEAKLDVASTQPLVGDTVVVAMRVANTPACATWSMFLRFDPAKLQFTGQWQGAEQVFVADSRTTTNINASGQVRIGGYGLSDVVRNGELVRLWFRAVATGVTEVATADRVEMSDFGNSMYTLAGVATRPATPSPVAISIGSNADNDHDGMPDAWEILHLGGTNAQAGADADGDGMSNLAEYRAGTNPQDTGSALQVSGFMCQNGTNFVVQWSSINGKTYAIQKATNLPSGFGTTEAGGIGATPPMNTYTANVSDAASGYYRITLE